MSWEYYILDGAPEDLSPSRECALTPLDPGIIEATLGMEDAWVGDTLVAELHVSRDATGQIRSVAAAVHFDAAPSEAELGRQRAEYFELLTKLVTLAEQLHARVWDPQRNQYLDRTQVSLVADAVG